MTNNNFFIPIVQKFFEHDTAAAVQSLESMIEKDAAGSDELHLYKKLTKNIDPSVDLLKSGKDLISQLKKK